MDHLKRASVNALTQLKELIQLLKNEEYSASLQTFHGSSVGQHVRHIIEFYQCLFSCDSQLDYDLRERDLFLENNSKAAVEQLDLQMIHIQNVKNDFVIELNSNFSNETNHKLIAPSSLLRELAYNLEHTVHHMAIIRLGVEQNFKNISLEKNFGVATSTQRNNQSSGTKSA